MGIIRRRRDGEPEPGPEDGVRGGRDAPAGGEDVAGQLAALSAEMERTLPDAAPAVREAWYRRRGASGPARWSAR
ncbi:hypothetical protein [Kitasatospora albolonga]|uniref:hypothetical protein n=1 Tax=Kitasatospora albolonga TaxID=68173 RepID=UPI0031E77B23